jgi:hypothetical protein
MVNIMVYHTIANQDDTIKLSIMENEKELYMPSLEFVEFDEYWDNPKYLFGELYESIDNYVNKTVGFEHLGELKDLDWLNEEIARDILEILEEGIKRGWDKAE